MGDYELVPHRSSDDEEEKREELEVQRLDSLPIISPYLSLLQMREIRTGIENITFLTKSLDALCEAVRPGNDVEDIVVDSGIERGLFGRCKRRYMRIQIRRRGR